MVSAVGSAREAAAIPFATTRHRSLLPSSLSFSCDKHIAMGVRFNANKKKVGMYYTTPIYEFQMGCHLCGGELVIRT